MHNIQSIVVVALLEVSSGFLWGQFSLIQSLKTDEVIAVQIVEFCMNYWSFTLFFLFPLFPCSVLPTFLSFFFLSFLSPSHPLSPTPSTIVTISDYSPFKQPPLPLLLLFPLLLGLLLS